VRWRCVTLTLAAVLAGCGGDALWSSADFTDDIAATIRERGHAPVERLVYPDAGHGIASPLPFIPLPAGDLGGSTRADTAARQDLWPRIVRLLDGQ
jgi:dienelactone hydrolase